MNQEKFSLSELFEIVDQKVRSKESDSYSYTIASQGVEKITRKIGEEALEVVIAAFMNEKKNDEISREELIGEVCDLYYHTLILLAERGIKFDEILKELKRRNEQK